MSSFNRFFKSCIAGWVGLLSSSSSDEPAYWAKTFMTNKRYSEEVFEVYKCKSVNGPAGGAACMPTQTQVRRRQGLVCSS